MSTCIAHSNFNHVCIVYNLHSCLELVITVLFQSVQLKSMSDVKNSQEKKQEFWNTNSFGRQYFH